MRIEFAQFTRFEQVELAVKAMEIIAGISGNCTLEDLPIDEEQLLDQMLNNAEAFGIETEVEHLDEERFSGKQLAREKFGNRVSAILEDRKDRLNHGYPFDLEFGREPSLVRHKKEDIAPVYAAAFALTLFLLLEDQEIVQTSERDRDQFRVKFGKLFELISAYALLAKVEGIVWWAGYSRGRVSFLEQLDELAGIVGYGDVKSKDQLEANQVHVNDGGVDAIGVSTHKGVVEADAICYLLGATYQRNARTSKIVGRTEIGRFKEFFDNVPDVAFLGILAIPYTEEPVEALNCRDQNCVYYPLTVIERNLGIASTKEYTPNVLQYVKKLGRQMREELSLAIHDLEITDASTTLQARKLFN